MKNEMKMVVFQIELRALGEIQKIGSRISSTSLIC